MSRGILRCALAVACAAVAFVTADSPALALRARGHDFAFSFASPGAATGVAVNEATGHVYVALKPNGQPGCQFGCVDELEVSPGTPTGEAKVVRTLEAPEPTSVAVDNAPGSPSRGDVYVAGETKKFVKEEEEESNIVYKFATSGSAPILKLKKFKVAKGEAEVFEAIEGVAVDSTGKLFVYDGGEDMIARFDNAEKNKSLFSVESEFGSAFESTAAPTPGIAVDSKGHVYLGHVSANKRTEGPSKTLPPVVGKCEIVGAECEPLIEELDQEATNGVAVDGADEAFLVGVATVKGTSLVAFTGEGAQVQHVPVPGIGEGSAIAVNSASGAIYISDANSGTVDVFALEPAGPPRVDSLSACLTTQCTPESTGVRLTAEVDPAGLDTTAHFQYGTSSCASSKCEETAPVDLGSRFGDEPLTAELELRQGVTYHFRVVASNGEGSVTSAEKTLTLPAAPPALPDGRAWEMVSPPEKNGFEAEPIIGAGGVIQSSTDGSAITYVADGPIHCEGEPEGSRSPEPAQILAVRGSAHWSCGDMSTANSAGIGANVGFPQEYQAFTPNLSLSLLEPFPGPEEINQWALPPLAPPVSAGEKQRQQEEPKRREEGKSYQEKTIYLHNDAPLQPEASSTEEQNNYKAAEGNGSIMGNAGFLALVTEANALGVLEAPTGCEEGLCFGGGKNADVEVVTATPDLSHVLFRSLKASPGVYEWSAGQLQLESLLPKNSEGKELPATGKTLPGRMPNVRHSISNDGTRVFWSEQPGAGLEAHLYLRDNETHETLQLDAPNKAETEKGFTPQGGPFASFQTANADGSRVFFTDTQRLTEGSKAVEGASKPDLYVYELPPGASSGTLTDLTPEGINGESGAVAGAKGGGGVIGANEDGTTVYFVANGALVPGATPGNCEVENEKELPQNSCNLYQMHLNEGQWETKLLAVLANTDSPDWGGAGFVGDLGFMTGRVSPNGRFLAFMSSRSLTGYDNEDATSKAKGEKLDEEVFLYDANQETLTCASCNPTGARPAGVLDLKSESSSSTEGVGLVVDRLGIWAKSDVKTDHWLAGSVPGWTPVSIERALYQSRYLSDEGRLFFNSPDHLVPAATGTKEKVYEYEPAGLGGCSSGSGCIGLLSSPNSEGEPTGEHESAFVDASESGNDVFFVTAAKLPAANGTSADVDSNFDLYDARACQQGSPCLGAPPLGSVGCGDETGCKGAAPGAPVSPPPASMTASASGNVAHIGTLPSKEASKPPAKKLTKAQLLAKALATCRKKYKGHSQSKRKAREKCEKTARKKYGHTSSHKSSHKASSAPHGGTR